MVFIFLISFAFAAQVDCMDSMAQLQAAKVKTTWTETTMNDGKPLVIVIREEQKKLLYTATKAGSIWLNGEVCISKDGKNLTLKHTKPTQDVPYLARKALPETQSGKIENDQVKLGGIAWSGTFVGK